MTNEEIQRVMEFIVKRQESFAGGMEQMRESHAKAEERVSRLEVAALHLYNETTELRKAQRELAEKMTMLAEAQAHTDQRAKALIDVIERWRNGKSES